ncbi:MAG: hypothetical protein JWN08_1458 [Frankiales bacterium]|nr:hypothetical protein [Frankiales bacterium]
MADAGQGPDEVWSADRIEATLPAELRAAFRLEHRGLLTAWQARAQALLGAQSAAEAPATVEPAHTPQKWGDLMDDWQL